MARGGEMALVASAPPLDYSFKELRSCAELETEDPRSGKKIAPPEPPGDRSPEGDAPEEAERPAGPAPPPAASLAGASSVGGPRLAPALSGKPIRKVLRSVTTAIKLNNNMLESSSGLSSALEFVMPSPIVNLQWVDLSFNQLVSIEPELLRFLNLKALYLHGNCIKSLASVDKLKKLQKLLSLTLNGNPIESTSIYRTYVIGAVPQIRSLDHSTITQDEVSNAAAWYKGHQERARKRAEDKQFGGPDDE